MGIRQSQLLYTYDFAKVGDKVPMIEFLDSLNIRERAKVYAFIEKLIELKNAGLNPKENLSKHLTDGIFEMRVSFENRIAENPVFLPCGAYDHIFTWLCKKDTENTVVRNRASKRDPYFKEHTMSIAKEYLKKQMDHPEFRTSFLDEKTRLDIEYQLEELKRDIAGCKPVHELLGKIDMIERFVQHA
ncbi:MAG: hypothetical protein WCP20_19180 [Desulfuromonadales bacterium]